MSRQLVQYAVVRKDLEKVLGWSKGEVTGHFCQTSTTVIEIFHQDPCTQEFLQDLDNIKCIVLEVPDESSLLKLHSQLKASKILHKLWIEHPTNIPTCIVLKPYPKQDVQQYFQGLEELT